MCRANGQDCPGYQKQLKWSSKHERFRPPIATPLPTPPQDGNGNADARRPPQQRAPTPQMADTRPSSSSTSAPMPIVSNDAVTSQAVPSMTSAYMPQHEEMADMMPVPEWPTFDTAGFEDFGLSDFPFVDDRLPFWLPQPSRHEAYHAGPRTDAVENPPHQRNRASQMRDDRSALSSSHGSPGTDTQRPGTSGSRRLLQTYYRTSLPGKVSGLTDQDFVNYYFHNVCTVYSCFDSAHNQFRSLVGDAWTTSATIYLAIQSMAAAHLANHYPSLASLGEQKRSQAWRYLQKDLQLHRVGKVSTETVLLSLLLLGPSSSWHQASNLGMQFLFIARNLMQTYLRESSTREDNALRDEEFYHHAMMRWEMVASFVDPVPFTALSGTMRLPEQELPTGQDEMFPHPWTGLAPEIHFAVAEVGRMLRRRRTHSGARPSDAQTGTSAYISSTDDQWVAALEGFLHGIELPDMEEIADYEDVRTPSGDLVMTADALRFVGLLEIYDLFPGQLMAHAERDTELNGFSFALTDEEHASSVSNPEVALAAMAAHILEIVKPIAITSAACRFLPFILFAAGCRLKLNGDISEQQQEEIVQARFLVEARMLLLSRKYPQKPQLQMLDIMKEVWQRLDQGSSESHWMDVADEKGWQTLMG